MKFLFLFFLLIFFFIPIAELGNNGFIPQEPNIFTEDENVAIFEMAAFFLYFPVIAFMIFLDKFLSINVLMVLQFVFYIGYSFLLAFIISRIINKVRSNARH